MSSGFGQLPYDRPQNSSSNPGPLRPYDTFVRGAGSSIQDATPQRPRRGRAVIALVVAGALGAGGVATLFADREREPSTTGLTLVCDTDFTYRVVENPGAMDRPERLVEPTGMEDFRGQLDPEGTPAQQCERELGSSWSVSDPVVITLGTGMHTVFTYYVIPRADVPPGSWARNAMQVHEADE